jgi:hypothetical protein
LGLPNLTGADAGQLVGMVSPCPAPSPPLYPLRLPMCACLWMVSSKVCASADVTGHACVHAAWRYGGHIHEHGHLFCAFVCPGQRISSPPCLERIIPLPDLPRCLRHPLLARALLRPRALTLSSWMQAGLIGLTRRTGAAGQHFQFKEQFVTAQWARARYHLFSLIARGKRVLLSSCTPSRSPAPAPRRGLGHGSWCWLSG